MHERVVFDCNVFVQALISDSGPAGKCVEAAISGHLSLMISNSVLDEIRGAVPGDPDRHAGRVARRTAWPMTKRASE